MTPRSRSDAEPLDVAIVGAGVSGVYVGWRLLASPPTERGLLSTFPGRPRGSVRNVAVFEASDRVGGRLLSVKPPGIPDVWCELGGMRFLTSQPLVQSLVENQLGLKTYDFPVDESENLNYIRGRRLRNSDLKNPDLVPYHLDWSEAGLDPGDLVGSALDRLIPGVTKLPSYQLRQILDTYQVDGRHIFDWGYWNLLARGMSHEAYEYARVTSGYDTLSLNWNAADTIRVSFDLGPEAKFKAVTDGYESLPLTLAEQFLHCGGALHLNHRLVSFDAATLPDGSDGVRLRIEQGDATGSGRMQDVSARAVVLAMPRRSLELLDRSGAMLGPDNHAVHQLIRTVTPIPLFKLVIAYHFPWWEAAGVTQGRSKTDLPVRQCYYWGVGPATGPNPANCNAVILATYDDTDNVAFWGGLAEPEHHKTFTSKKNLFVQAHRGSPNWKQHRATQPMVVEAHRQLQEMHGLRYVPEPYEAAYMDWSVDPYGGGVNWWNIHVRSADVIDRMIRPEPTVPAFVCGEAYSNGQGWVEGALETAELLLQHHFGLEAPDWVTGS